MVMTPTTRSPTRSGRAASDGVPGAMLIGPKMAERSSIASGPSTHTGSPLFATRAVNRPLSFAWMVR